MTIERREKGKISPEDATFRILSGCGIEQIKFSILSNSLFYEAKITELHDVLSEISTKIKKDVTSSGSVYVRVTGKDREFQIEPSFVGSDQNRYVLHNLIYTRKTVAVDTTVIEPYARRTRKETMDPLDLLSRMP